MRHLKRKGSDMKKSVFVLFSLLSIALSLGLGYLFAKSKESTKFPLEHATVLTPPKDLDGIVLINDKGLLIDREALKGRWRLLTVGYGLCHDTCPATLGYLKGELDELTAKGVEVGFISVDPARDTPQSVAKFLAAIDSRFTAYLASETMAPKLTELLGAYIAKNADGTMNHSNAIFVIDPEARWVAVYNQPPEKGLLAKDIGRITMR